MKLIAGLGNPGFSYSGSRHNIGFMVVKDLARYLKTGFKRDRQASSMLAECAFEGTGLVLAMPQTFMNLSGAAVSSLLKRFKLEPRDILVVCDDMDLELGRIRIRAKGSSGGQRGLSSIIERLGRDDFNRLRIGIGRPPRPEDASSYVLAGFPRKEKVLVEQAKEEAVSCCLSWIKEGIIVTMDSFNTRSKNE
ncbi:MAG: aminoacyl-tRNA hydrolase [Candidatus Omnitrophica bacterium]|nr:aminoacyl-tRNA hydrolase [Candidatus Omnitrophota bacterium]